MTKRDISTDSSQNLIRSEQLQHLPHLNQIMRVFINCIKYKKSFFLRKVSRQLMGEFTMIIMINRLKQRIAAQ